MAQNKSINNYGQQLEKKFAPYFTDKAPLQLSTPVRQMLVKIVPWLVLFGLVLSLPWLLLALAVGTSIGLVGPVSGVELKPLFYLSMVLLILQAVLIGFAIPKLFGKRYQGWRLLFYALLVNVAYIVLKWLSMPGAVLSLGVALLIDVGILYILFQLRPEYRSD